MQPSLQHTGRRRFLLPSVATALAALKSGAKGVLSMARVQCGLSTFGTYALADILAYDVAESTCYSDDPDCLALMAQMKAIFQRYDAVSQDLSIITDPDDRAEYDRLALAFDEHLDTLVFEELRNLGQDELAKCLLFGKKLYEEIVGMGQKELYV